MIGWHSGWGLTDIIWLGAVDEQREEFVFGIGHLDDASISGQVLRSRRYMAPAQRN